MDYEVLWAETWCEDTTGLCIDSNRYTYEPKVHLRYLDFTDRDGKPFGECCYVIFRGSTPAEERRVMQTVLMMAKAKYGL